MEEGDTHARINDNSKNVRSAPRPYADPVVHSSNLHTGAATRNHERGATGGREAGARARTTWDEYEMAVMETTSWPRRPPTASFTLTDCTRAWISASAGRSALNPPGSPGH